MKAINLSERETHLLQELLLAVERNIDKDRETSRRLVANALEILQLAQFDTRALSD